MLVCALCGRENTDDSRFCNGCGAELVPARGAVAEERKVVTVLFADVSGSSGLGERLDAEELKEARRESRIEIGVGGASLPAR